MTAPTEDLIRAVLKVDAPREAPPLFRTTDDNDDELGTLVGYAAVFDQWTEISSFFEGNFLERIRPRAFRKTLRENGDAVKVLFNHGMDFQVGDKPLGRWEVLREDKMGLYTETPLDDTSYNRDLAASLRSGALDGMSFRFRVLKEEWRDDPGKSDHNPKGLPERDLLEIRLFEFGPVTFPAYKATSAGIRSREGYALWLGTPPAQRDEMFRKFGLDSTEAADVGTSDRGDDQPPTSGTGRSGKSIALAFFMRRPHVRRTNEDAA